jgi:hypothetical protein
MKKASPNMFWKIKARANTIVEEQMRIKSRATRQSIKSIKQERGARQRNEAKSRQESQKSAAIRTSRMTNKKPTYQTAAQGAAKFLKNKGKPLENANFDGITVPILKDLVRNKKLKPKGQTRKSLINALRTETTKEELNKRRPTKVKTSKKNTILLQGGSWESQLYNILLGKITKQYKSSVNKKKDLIINEISRLNIRKGRGIITNNKQEITPKQYLDILLLVWLDGIHDGYIVTGFEQWLQKQVNSEIFIQPSMTDVNDNTLGGLFGYLRNSNDTQKVNLYKNIKNSLNKETVSFTAGWERHVKDFLIHIYTDQKRISTGIYTGKIVSNNTNMKLALAVDQQYSSSQEQTLTRLIDNDNIVGLITFGQALDGSTMLPGLITAELQSATQYGVLKDIEPKNRKNSSGVQPTTFKGQSKYALFGYEHILKLGNNDVFKLSLSNEQTPLPELKFNNKTLNLTQSAGAAKKASNADQVGKISKYFGDALQYILFTHLAKQPTKPSNRGVSRYMFLGSGDSMMLLGYKIFCDIENVQPRMIIDGSGSHRPGIHVVNLPKEFTLKTNQVQSVSGAATNITRQVGNNAQSRRRI